MNFFQSCGCFNATTQEQPTATVHILACKFYDTTFDESFLQQSAKKRDFYGRIQLTEKDVSEQTVQIQIEWKVVMNFTTMQKKDSFLVQSIERLPKDPNKVDLTESQEKNLILLIEHENCFSGYFNEILELGQGQYSILYLRPQNQYINDKQNWKILGHSTIFSINVIGAVIDALALQESKSVKATINKIKIFEEQQKNASFGSNLMTPIKLNEQSFKESQYVNKEEQFKLKDNFINELSSPKKNECDISQVQMTKGDDSPVQMEYQDLFEEVIKDQNLFLKKGKKLNPELEISYNNTNQQSEEKIIQQKDKSTLIDENKMKNILTELPIENNQLLQFQAQPQCKEQIITQIERIKQNQLQKQNIIVPLKNEEFQSQENIIDYLKQTLKLEPYVQAPTQNEEIKQPSKLPSQKQQRQPTLKKSRNSSKIQIKKENQQQQESTQAKLKKALYLKPKKFEDVKQKQVLNTTLQQSKQMLNLQCDEKKIDYQYSSQTCKNFGKKNKQFDFKDYNKGSKNINQHTQNLR